MTREEFDRLYLNKRVHCDTEEKANEFLALADSVGYKWKSGKSLIEINNWETYKEETCYDIEEDGFMFSSTSYFIWGVIKYQPQPKFKVGDKVRVKDTIYTTINGKVGVIIKKVNTLNTMFCLVNIDGWTWRLTENELEKVEEPTNKEETIDDIIGEIKEHQEKITILLNRLEQEVKNK